MIQVKVFPGLTLADTRFEVAGTGKADLPLADHFVSAVYNYERARGFDFDGVFPVVDTSEVEAQAVIESQHVPPPAISPAALDHEVWDNSDSKTPTTFHAELSASVKASTTVTWSESATVGFAFQVGIEVSEGGVKVTGSTTYSFSATVGHETSKSVEREVGVSTGVERDVPGGEVDVAILLIQEGTLKAAINFERLMSGNVRWRTRYGGDPWKTIPIAALVKDQPHLLAPVRATAYFGVDFATDNEIKVVPADSSSTADVDAAIKHALGASAYERLTQ